MKNLRKERKTLTSIVEFARHVNDRDEFFRYLYPRLHKILPHSRFICGILSAVDHYVHSWTRCGFPDRLLVSIMANDGSLCCPVFLRWLRTKRPVLVMLPADMHASTVPGEMPAESTAPTEIAIVAHGFVDYRTNLISYVSFSVDLDTWDDNKEFLLEMVVPHLHTALSRMAMRTSGQPQEIGKLSARERTVLRWMCEGKSNDEIAMILDLSVWTVKVHVKNIMQKLNSSTRTGTVVGAIRKGSIAL